MEGTSAPAACTRSQDSSSRAATLPPSSSSSSSSWWLYGWRRRCLQVGLAVLALLVGCNVALTLFILRGLHFSLSGMGKMEIQEGSIKVRGRTDIQGTLFTAQVRSAQEALLVKSQHNLSINSRNVHGKVTSRMELDPSGVEVLADWFSVRAPSGRLLFHRDEQDVVFGVDTLKIAGQRRVSVKGSIQTPVVRAEQFQPVKMESVTRKVIIRGPEKVQLGARLGTIKAHCARDLHLASTGGIISLSAPQIHFSNLRRALPASKGKVYPGIHQLCACDNGRLFAAPPVGHCHSDQAVCK